MKKWTYNIDDMNFFIPTSKLTAIFVVAKNIETGAEYGYSLDVNGDNGHDRLNGEVPYILVADEDYNGNYPTIEEDKEIRAGVSFGNTFWNYVKKNYKLSENENSQYYLDECERIK